MEWIFMLIAMILFSLWGIFFIFSSLHPSSMAEDAGKEKPEFYRIYGAYWRDRLFEWHVVDQESNVPSVRKEVIISWELIQRPVNFAGGLAV